MKKYLLFALFFILLMTTIAAPVAARGQNRVGDRISVFSDEVTYPAGEPFHIAQGWVIVDPLNKNHQDFRFRLEIDGTHQVESFVQHSVHFTVDGELSTLKEYVYNFRRGMTGTHTFTGYWIVSCTEAVEAFGHPGPCLNPRADVELTPQTVIVHFE